MAISCEYNNESLGFIKGGKFLDSMTSSLSERILLHEVHMFVCW